MQVVEHLVHRQQKPAAVVGVYMKKVELSIMTGEETFNLLWVEDGTVAVNAGAGLGHLGDSQELLTKVVMEEVDHLAMVGVVP